MSKLAEEIAAELTNYGLDYPPRSEGDVVDSPHEQPQLDHRHRVIETIDRLLEAACFPPSPSPAPDYVPRQRRQAPTDPVGIAQEQTRYRTVRARLAMRRGDYDEAQAWLTDAISACRDQKRLRRVEHEAKREAEDAELLLARTKRSEGE